MNRSSLVVKGLMAAVVAVCGMSAHAADKVTLQLKWLPQAQFAGYYVAQAKGYYKAEGLDVTIKPGGPDIGPAQVIAGNGADVSWTGCPRLWPRAKRACPWSTSPRCSTSPA
jgi:NitT/TauT family transport system substrate-binding protein